jgi:hypothetical protein
MDAVTLHLYARPATPAASVSPLMTQIAELYEFGFLGPGSRVWANAEIPGSMWVLSDRSTFVRVVDVPAAGWVRLTQSSAVWGRTAAATTNPALAMALFSTAEMPIPLQPRDVVTLLIRNADQERMRAIYGGRPQPMEEYETTHGAMRAVDYKVGQAARKASFSAPREWEAAHAVLRGVDLMAATAPAMHELIRENLDAYTTTIDEQDFDRLRARHERTAQETERFLGRVLDGINGLQGATL